MVADARLWEDFSFVAASSYRERVIHALAGKPKFPKDLAGETDLRIVHVSRALREMRGRGLVELLTPAAKARGRLYGVTASGAVLLKYLDDSSRRFVPPAARGLPYVGFVPKIRGSSVLRLLAVLREAKGEAALRDATHSWSMDTEQVEEDTWVSVDAGAELLELVEAKFGDGSYAFIRSLFAQAGPSFPTIQAELARKLPLATLAERAPVVYGKEWNFGRLEVETANRRAAFRHYDWMPTPAMCSMFHGIYEGVLRWRGFPGKVLKARCVREGDDCCEYVAEW
ncbi:MAG: hypothetical protein E6K18_02510 [Methanobacteriota archaeon]|nr:MAG: hypothetical protein E6K18_02510 [Euryarchaeota archaeon]